MILTCPECSAKYMVAADSIGDKGRDVRCAKCGHTWHQRSEKDSLDELIDRIQSQKLDDIDFGDGVVLNKPKKEEKKKGKPVGEILGAFFSKLLPKPENRGRVLKGALAGAVLSLLMLGGGVGVMSFGKEHPSEKEMFGDEKTIAFDHLDVSEDSRHNAILNGVIINITKDELKLPPVVVEIKGKDGKTIFKKEWIVREQPLKAEEQADFAFRFGMKIPDTAEKIELRLLAPQEETGDQSSAEGDG